MNKQMSLFQIKISQEDIDKLNNGLPSPVMELHRNLVCFGSEKWVSGNDDFSRFFHHVADISTTGDDIEASLEFAFMAMQRVDIGRCPENNPAVTDMTGGNRYGSMSVGDIVRLDEVYYMVEDLGFKELEWIA